MLIGQTDIDADAILSLIRDCAEGLSPSLNDPAVAQVYASKVYHRATLVGEQGVSQLSGLIAFYCNDQITRRAFITLVAVRPSSRGRGIGSRLMDETIACATQAGCTSIRLAVLRDNHAAIRLYEAKGFAIIDEARTQFVMDRDL